jgi:hypothetical protein
MAKIKGMNKKLKVRRMMLKRTSNRIQEAAVVILKSGMVLEDSMHITLIDYGKYL